MESPQKTGVLPVDCHCQGWGPVGSQLLLTRAIPPGPDLHYSHKTVLSEQANSLFVTPPHIPAQPALQGCRDITVTSRDIPLKAEGKNIFQESSECPVHRKRSVPPCKGDQ